MDRYTLVKNIVETIQNGVFVEIGTHTGDFANHILANSTNSVLYCIDPYISYDNYDHSINNITGDELYNNTYNKLKSLYGERVIFVRKFADDAVCDIPSEIDFLYIDGNHRYKYVYNDLTLYYPKVKENSYIVGDDIQRNENSDVFINCLPGCYDNYGVIKAFREFCENHNINGDIIGNQYQIKKIQNGSSLPMSHIAFLEVYNYSNKIRYGEKSDGGYVVAVLDGGYDCYISAGISNEESFTRDFLIANQLEKDDCYGFDGTIEEYPSQYSENITFIKKNINSYNDENNTDMVFLIEKYNTIFLKMDIEAGEYPWLLKLDEPQLQKFKQIVIEFHGINNSTWNCEYINKVKCLEKLAKTHYLVHAHGNNHSIVVNNIPDVIELTYVNKQYFDFVPEFNTKALPIQNLDYANAGHAPDIYLNFYPFVRSV